MHKGFMMELENKILRYRELKKSIEDLEEQLESVRTDILTLTGNKEYEGHGLEIIVSSPSPSFDWRTAIRVWNKTDEDIAPYLKERKPLFRFIVKRGIEL